MLTIEYTDSDLKVHALHYANELLVRRQSSNSVNTRKQDEKMFKGKGNDAYSLSIRVQTTINHNSICFLPQYQRQRKWLFFSARAENGSFSARELKKALRDTLTRAACYGLLPTAA